MPPANSKVYVSNMKPSTDERALSEMFMRFGDITQITHKGSYAFVEFADAQCALEAIKEMSQSSEMRVQMAFSKKSGGFGGGGYGNSGGNDYSPSSANGGAPPQR